MKKNILLILSLIAIVAGAKAQNYTCSDPSNNGDTTIVVLCAEDYNINKVGGDPTTMLINLNTASQYAISGHIEMTSVYDDDFIVLREVNASGNTIRQIGLFSGTQDVQLFTLNTQYIAIDIYCFNGAVTYTSGFNLTIRPTEKTSLEQVAIMDKLGVGTVSPEAKLHVVGDIKISKPGYSLQINPQANSTFTTTASYFSFNKPLRSNGGVFSTAASTNLTLQTYNTPRVTIKANNGNVGIGTTTPNYKLDVAGEIHSDSIRSKMIKTGAVFVESVYGADYVFDEHYQLRPLQEVYSFVQEHGHLPEIQSAEDMQQNGVNMSDFQIQLLQKIEELTLYIILQEQRIKELENQISK